MKFSRIESVKIAKKREATKKQRERKKRNELKKRKKEKQIPNDFKTKWPFCELKTTNWNQRFIKYISNTVTHEENICIQMTEFHQI